MLQRGTYLAGDGSTFVKWCGLLINISNLELQADYTRYAGLPLSSTLTVPLSKVLPSDCPCLLNTRHSFPFVLCLQAHCITAACFVCKTAHTCVLASSVMQLHFSLSASQQMLWMGRVLIAMGKMYLFNTSGTLVF